MSSAEDLAKLAEYVRRIPAVKWLSHSAPTEPDWWVKFSIDLSSPIAWHVVQELGHVLNYLSPDERLPTVFYPVSPPPYLNGGPEEFLSWVIEPKIASVDAGVIADYLEGRLPDPVNVIGNWLES
ncbi:MAG TPA: hypothetical protein VFW40_07085 [Capsulimonadaceae bacterium]|nr:hypothetical protein [Capsulimonadaceae bacterium]